MRVADIQRFCMHDGPGVRTTVFLKGCPLRCAWCHNPETQKYHKELLYYESRCIGCGACAVCSQRAQVFSGRHTFRRDLCIGCGKCADECPTGALEMVGEDLGVEILLERIEKDRVFYGAQGGVTLSGGEPFLQAEEVLALLGACKERGIHTAVETCGCFPSEIVAPAVALTDLFLWDIKDTDPRRHMEYTGVSNSAILSNLLLADQLGARTRLRCILVSGVNTQKQHYQAVADLAGRLEHCEGVEFLPYHTFGGAKSAAMGMVNGNRDLWIPHKDRIREATECLRERGIGVFNEL